jgi:aspartyl-tRNA(Asn)/glutamyl-tRNA(Gln) amidotransferase subunit B
MKYETVIGLEVHVELATDSKIFCSCSAHSYGAEPNTHVCPACCGMPGMLPVVNKRVVDYGMKAGLMLNCDINRTTTFDKKKSPTTTLLFHFLFCCENHRKTKNVKNKNRRRIT